MRELKVLPIRKAKSKYSRRQRIPMLQLSDFRKSEGELKRLMELHQVKIGDDEEGDEIKEGEKKDANKVLPPALVDSEEDDSSDVEVVYTMKSGNVTTPDTIKYYVTEEQ